MSNNSFEYALDAMPGSARIDLRTLMDEMARPVGDELTTEVMVRDQVQASVTHLMLGRSEPLPFEAAREARRPAWADETPFSCWDDPLDDDDDDEEKLPTVRRPVPITNTNTVRKTAACGKTEVNLAGLSAWMDKAQDDIRRAFGMPSFMLREDHGFRSLVHGSEIEVAILMEDQYHGR